MNAYLDIAEEVLRRVRRPLTAREILKVAYQSGLAPVHLRGRTQFKTMGARLSVDILELRELSRFYRTAPGKFLLREQINDLEIPEELRRPIIARRRKRALMRDRALAIDRDVISPNALQIISNTKIMKMIECGDFHYTSDPKHRSRNDILVWSFALVIRDGCVLSYRQGPYREERDNFLSRRTIGFYAPVVAGDRGLFDQLDHGILNSGVRALAMDLDLLDQNLWPVLTEGAQLKSFVYTGNGIETGDLLAVIAFVCPDWLDPSSKRLAINDLEWLDIRLPRNHMDDFDPWSKAILSVSNQLALNNT